MDEDYHVCNRGVLKRDIFLDDRDRARFLFLLLTLQSPGHTPHNIGGSVSYFIKHRMFNISERTRTKIKTGQGVQLSSFMLRPNHFHLLVKEVQEGGVAKYLQRLGNAYTKYFNTKYKQNGHLFQGPYRSVHIENNDQLLYASAYIHKHGPIGYEWSSYQDYVKSNRWPELLGRSLILEQFTDPKEYYEWVRNSTAKEISENIEHPMLDI